MFFYEASDSVHAVPISPSNSKYKYEDPSLGTLACNIHQYVLNVWSHSAFSDKRDSLHKFQAQTELSVPPPVKSQWVVKPAVPQNMPEPHQSFPAEISDGQ